MGVTKYFWVESEVPADQVSEEAAEGRLADSRTWKSKIRSGWPLRQKKDPLTWTTTWKRLGPIVGLLGLLIAILGTTLSFAILWASDGVPTRKWTIGPSTYLAIATAIVNQALGHAALQGAVIAWWMRAMNGSTIGALHRDWHSATSLFGALSAGRFTNLLAVACILSSLVAVDGPLLQRATHVEDREFNEPAQLHMNMAPELPHGLSGTYFHGAYNGSGTIMHGKSMHYSPAETNYFTNTALEWASKSPIKASARGCKGTCKARVEAPALAKTACTSQQYPFRPSKSSVKADALKSLDSITFYTDFEVLPHEDYESINFTVAYRTASVETCDLGHVTYTNCQLRSAVGLYEIQINDDHIDIPSPGSAEILRLANNTATRGGDALPLGDTLSTLGGVVFQAFTVFNSLAHGYVNENGVFQNLGFTGFVQQFSIALTDEETIKISEPSGPCHDNWASATMLAYRFSDPTDYMLARLNELMFRFGITMADFPTVTDQLGPSFDKATSSNQTVLGAQFGRETVYVTTYWWFGAGALAELVCILCILPTYWGWWRLGRSVSFSPIEMANAFEAPLLHDAGGCPSNASGREVSIFMRGREVRYGAIGGNARYSGGGYEAKKVAFASSDVVYRLSDGCRFES